MVKKITLEDEKKAVNKVERWVGAGKDAFQVVQKIESAKLHGEPVELSKKEQFALVSGAVKMYLDGNISPRGKQILLANNIDPDFIRRDIVEATMPQAIANIIAQGDIERFVALGQLAGEKPAEEIPANAKRIVRERVEITIED